MSRTAIIIAAGLAFAAVLPAAPALAQRERVFVASYGSDTNPCTFGSPCKTFAQAITVVASGGEITAIDSAGFGPVTIEHSITITSPAGVEAGIVPVSGGNAITINAGPTDAVVLRGLTLNGSGVGNNGIEFDAGGSLIVQNTAIQQFTGTGIYFVPNGPSKLFVSNTLVANNKSDGIAVYPTSTEGIMVQVVLNRVEADNNGNNGIGMNAARGPNTTIEATASESVAAGNTAAGFSATKSAGLSAEVVELNLFRCFAVSNGTGIVADGMSAFVTIAQTDVDEWELSNGGSLATYGDNYGGGFLDNVVTVSKF